MSSLVITVRSELSQAELQSRYQPESGRAKEQAGRLQRLFHRLAGGLASASVDVNTGSADPAAAAGTLTLTYASIAAADTVTIGGTVLTCRASGAAAGTEFNKTTDATVTAANLAAAINANTTLSKFMVATSALGVVTVTLLVKGVIGNAIVLATSNGSGFALVQPTGGAGGSMDTAVSYSLGL